MEQMAWERIRSRSDCVGRWVALDRCVYNMAGQAMAGAVVDADDDLAELCLRVRSARLKHCAILFCD